MKTLKLNRYLLYLIFGLFHFFECKAQAQKLPVDYINPMIGAYAPAGSNLTGKETGRTVPGPIAPFGLVQLSPDTYTGGDNGNGYSYFNNTIEGFSFTHMSGIGWFGDLGNFLVMPTTGALKTVKGNEDAPEQGYRSTFSHDNEVVKAGYYSVFLDDYKVKVELTTAQRAGMIRFTFPENKQSRIQIDLARRIGGTSTEQYVKVENEHTISGWMKCPPEGGGWGNGDGKADYTVYFWCEFSKPLKNVGVWSAEIPDGVDRRGFSRVMVKDKEGKNKYQVNQEVFGEAYQQRIANAKILPGVREKHGKHLGFYTEFASKEGEEVLMKCGISFVNLEGAKENLQHDIPHWEFDKVAEQTRNSWNEALSNVKASGSTEDNKIKFYTALYRTMLDPRSFSDVNGNYIGADGLIHQTNDFIYRTIFSGWDVFRSQFPLLTIIKPEIVNDEVNSLIQMAELSGRKYYPRWEFLNSYSGCMLGNPAVSVIVDAYEKGIRNYDIEKAFIYCKNSVDKFGNGKQGFTSGDLSKTLEYAYTDWCVGRFAESLGKKELADEYYTKGQAYRNVWNEDVHWFRARKDADNWLNWKGKTVHGQGCTESNPFQQGWFVPHDVDGMINLMGKEYFFKELSSFFENTPENIRWNDYYNHANEPVHHVPFLFNEINRPWLTQKWTRMICNNAYGTDVFGLCGNEDVGQMSAWYVLTAMGIHPISPGDNKYQITSPVFNKIEIDLDSNYYSGKKFTILAKYNSIENIYIQSIKLNGEPLERYWITHEEITKGGILEMIMGPNPVDITKQ
jgi:predicted alpha-1,2-mannosidase